MAVLAIKDIKRHKGIPEKEELLDRAGRAELASNEFRITQTEEKLRKEKVRGQIEAERVHLEVGKSVRGTIVKLGGTMPEDLPPEPSLKKLAARKRKKQLSESASN